VNRWMAYQQDWGPIEPLWVQRLKAYVGLIVFLLLVCLAGATDVPVR
jgi:hypothetical protein